MAKHPEVGDPAPDFELQGTYGRFKLSDHRGQRVVLLFYPGDNTPVCTRQFCSYRDNAEAFAALDARVVGISSQNVDSHESFTAEHGLNVPLLADEGSKVAKAYGARPRTFSGPSGRGMAVPMACGVRVMRAPPCRPARAARR